MSVPDGVESMVLRRSRVPSAFLRYKGSQLRSVCTDGVCGGGEEEGGDGMALSGGATPCISDILENGGFPTA